MSPRRPVPPSQCPPVAMSPRRPAPFLPAPMSPDLSRTVGFVLAGGEGRRLHELTHSAAKPALHLAGTTRLVDFAMSNLWRAGIGKVLVATQHCPATLARHLAAV